MHNGYVDYYAPTSLKLPNALLMRIFSGAVFGVLWDLATLHQKVRSKMYRRGATG
jgi:hypothetical protein